MARCSRIEKYSHVKNVLNTGLRRSVFALVNLCLLMMFIPRILRTTKMIPLGKPGKDSSLLSGWRPIALLCVVLKLVEHIVAVRLLRYLLDLKAYVGRHQVL